MNKEPITLNGLNKLKEELIFLKEKKRPKVVLEKKSIPFSLHKTG